MSEISSELQALSRSVFDSAWEAAFALMQANYSERAAPELGPQGKVQGLEPQARDLAIRFRESIWYRFDAMRFHHELLTKVHDGYVQALVKAGPLGMRDGSTHDLAFNAVHREQALFDDLVFHSISLFDYLGNAVWFGFHGQNYVKKKWQNASRAAREPEFERKTTRGRVRIHGSSTGTLISKLDGEFVGRLADYRAKVFHYHVDAATAGVTHRFESTGRGGGEATWHPELDVRLPADYAKSVRALIQLETGDDTEVLLLAGAEALVRRVGLTAITLLDSLATDLGWDKSKGLVILG